MLKAVILVGGPQKGMNVISSELLTFRHPLILLFSYLLPIDD